VGKDCRHEVRITVADMKYRGMEEILALNSTLLHFLHFCRTCVYDHYE
jgi:hypothetical protein